MSVRWFNTGPLDSGAHYLPHGESRSLCGYEVLADERLSWNSARDNGVVPLCEACKRLLRALSSEPGDPP